MPKEEMTAPGAASGGGSGGGAAAGGGAGAETRDDRFIGIIVDRTHSSVLSRFAPGVTARTIRSPIQNAYNDDEIKIKLKDILRRSFANKYTVTARSGLYGCLPHISCGDEMSILDILNSDRYFNNDRREQFITALVEELTTHSKIYEYDPDPIICCFWRRTPARVVASLEYVFIDMTITIAIVTALQIVGMPDERPTVTARPS